MTDEVLLLDDDAAMLAILEGVLTGAGYRCLVAADPEDALKKIVDRPEVSVVLSDIFMPGLTGLEFVDRLNALALDRPAPRVVLLTAKPSLEAAVNALRLGANDFLVKPFQIPDLLDAVSRAMSQARQDRMAQARPDRVGQGSRPPQVEQLMRQAEELAGRLRRLAYARDSLADTGLPAQPALERDAGEPDQGRPGAAARSGTSRAQPHSGATSAAAQDVPPSLASGAGSAGGAGPAQAAGVVPLSVLDTIEQLRRLRSRYEHHKLDDVAWELLLELLRAERTRQSLSVSGLTISISGVSATTSLRRMNELTARGYLTRVPDPADARRDFVSLTPMSHELLADYLDEANTLLR